MLIKRGGMGSAGPGPVELSTTSPTAVTTITASPSAHHDLAVPQIGGSSAGFIALVTVLATFVVLCCVGVFILLRTHNPTPYERRIQEAERRARGSSLYEVPLGPHGMRERFKRWFGGKRGAGWVRASGDEWYTGDEAPLGRVAEPKGPRTADAEASPYIPSQMRDRDMSAESVGLEAAHEEHAPPTGRAAPIFIPDHYADPYSDSPASLEGHRADTDMRMGEGKFSVQTASPGSGDNGSVRSMRKFQGGTKFRESLE